MYRIATFIASLFLLASGALAQQATFEGLGGLKGGDFYYSEASSISVDGSVVVGRSSSEIGANSEAFRWTEERGMEGLGILPDGDISIAYGVSADGSVVVGLSYLTASPEAFRWEEGEMEGLGVLPNGDISSAYGVSADGSVVVGESGSEDWVELEAFRWTTIADSMEGLGYLPGGELFSSATDVSADGSVIVGSGNSSKGGEAFRWTEATGSMEGLGHLPEGDFSRANGVSSDGSVVVGRGSSANSGSEAFRWEDGVMEGLGFLPSDDFLSSSAQDVSEDGSIVIGSSSSENTIFTEAFYWTAKDGMQNLKDVLEDDYGLDLTGWSLSKATDITEDGTIIVGSGFNPNGDIEAWRAFLGKPVDDEATPQALVEVLGAPSPNPASGTSTFTIAVEHGQHVAVEVFDVMGRHMQTVYEGALAAGVSETLTLDASALPTGVYMIRATGEDFTRTQRVTVVR